MTAEQQHTISVRPIYRNAFKSFLTKGRGIFIALMLVVACSEIAAQSTTVTVTSTNNPFCSGSNLSFTATVNPSAATGTVQFFDGAISLGTATLSGGVATFSTSSLSAGSHPITAIYLGGGTYTGSTSAILNQTINTYPPIS